MKKETFPDFHEKKLSKISMKKRNFCKIEKPVRKLKTEY
jgi:hypothetical protein